MNVTAEINSVYRSAMFSKILYVGYEDKRFDRQIIVLLFVSYYLHWRHAVHNMTMCLMSAP